MAIPAITPTGGTGAASGTVQPVPPASAQSGTTSYGYGANAGASAGANGFGPAAIVNLSPEAQKALARLTGIDIAAAQTTGGLEKMLRALPDRALSDAAARAGARTKDGPLPQTAAAADMPRLPQPTPEQLRHLVQFLVEQDRRLYPGGGGGATPASGRPAGHPALPEQDDKPPPAAGNFQIHADAHGVTIFQGSKDITAAVMSGALSTQAQAVLLSALPPGVARLLRPDPRRRGRGPAWKTMLLLGGIVMAVIMFLTLR
ncbi:hypothetical protein [Sphingomonas quercus]|uniref:Uncharacterized protein n=1 Tax=Sphingomonas quercus TaxID=2842451 RepID=A0ABS6BMD6_9SPHN|nr:hypothetical protein [Sphingomonas quercus]MBU3078941.1 hypothetical protein [Sphingomonas quercus]